MTDTDTRSDGDSCFVCGQANEHGLQVRFRLEDGVCKAEFTPDESFCGYTGVTHGGILFSLLDDVMANWLYLQGERAFTGKCEIRFREPAPVGAAITLEGQQLGRKGRIATMQGKAFSAASGKLLAEATATFVVIPDG